MVLIGYWPLKESSGSTAYDHSGNENHGTISDGGDSTVPGATGVLEQNAYSFDGSNDVVDIPSSSSIESFEEGITVSAWVYTPTRSGDKNKLMFKSNTFNFQPGWQSGGSRFEIHVNGDWRGLTGVEVPANEWFHFTTLYDGSEMKVFLNGVLKASRSQTGFITNSSTELHLSQPNYMFQGRASEMRIYNHALTPREVQYLYKVGKRGRQTTSRKSS